ncbi:hypothetical protein EVC28_027 [Rhizobium phage RHph_I1_23]|nr:hypothetical protein EVC28_027 [Rhizobium phage RHph_I1_23]
MFRRYKETEVDMVEKVADAILKHLVAGGESIKDIGDGLIKIDGCVDLYDVARAAIDAMRESTDAMDDAGEKAIYDLPRHIAVMAYEVMIDAAIKEHEGSGR